MLKWSLAKSSGHMKPEIPPQKKVCLQMVTEVRAVNGNGHNKTVDNLLPYLTTFPIFHIIKSQNFHCVALSGGFALVEQELCHDHDTPHFTTWKSVRQHFDRSHSAVTEKVKANSYSHLDFQPKCVVRISVGLEAFS